MNGHGVPDEWAVSSVRMPLTGSCGVSGRAQT